MMTTPVIDVEVAPEVPPQQSAPRTRPRRVRGAVLPYLLIAPLLVAVLIALGWPLLQQFLMSLQKFGLAQQFGAEPEWVGLANYGKILTDPDMWVVFFRSVLFCAVCASLSMVIGMLIALLLTKVSSWARIALQITLLLVWATPALVTMVIWQWLFDARYGLVNWVLARIGFPEMAGFPWTSTPMGVFTIAAITVIWGSLPLIVFMIHSALTQVPGEVLEAAELDGAGPWARFRHVTLPLITPAEEQRARMLPAMAAGELITAFALTEEVAGSDAAHLRTTAVRRGDTYVPDNAVTLDILSQTNEFLPLEECYFLADKGYDVKLIYNTIKDIYHGNCYIPLNMRNTKNPKKLPIGNPICDAGLAMHKDGVCKSEGRSRQKFCCPFKRTKRDCCCPCNHKNWNNGKKNRGCTKYITIPDDYRLSIDRISKDFKSIYRLRTEVERYNSRFKTTGQERLWVRNQNSAQNLNSIAHISLLAIALVAIVTNSKASYRSIKSVKRTA